VGSVGAKAGVVPEPVLATQKDEDFVFPPVALVRYHQLSEDRGGARTPFFHA
jgi:hypothetical protein